MAALMFVLFVAGVGGGSFVCTALHKFVVFDARARSVLMHPWIRVNVDMAICPVALPANVVDEDGVTGPNNARSAPTPGVEPGADGYAEADGRANHKAGPRGREHDQRIVDRDHDERRIRGHDVDVRTAGNDDGSAGAQVAILFSPVAPALRRHALREKNKRRDSRGSAEYAEKSRPALEDRGLEFAVGGG